MVATARRRPRAPRRGAPACTSRTARARAAPARRGRRAACPGPGRPRPASAAGCCGSTSRSSASPAWSKSAKASRPTAVRRRAERLVRVEGVPVIAATSSRTESPGERLVAGPVRAARTSPRSAGVSRPRAASAKPVSEGRLLARARSRARPREDEPDEPGHDPGGRLAASSRPSSLSSSGGSGPAARGSRGGRPGSPPRGPASELKTAARAQRSEPSRAAIRARRRGDGGRRRRGDRAQGDRRLEPHAGVLVVGTGQHVVEPAGSAASRGSISCERVLADRRRGVPQGRRSRSSVEGVERLEQVEGVDDRRRRRLRVGCDRSASGSTAAGSRRSSRSRWAVSRHQPSGLRSDVAEPRGRWPPARSTWRSRRRSSRPERRRGRPARSGPSSCRPRSRSACGSRRGGSRGARSSCGTCRRRKGRRRGRGRGRRGGTSCRVLARNSTPSRAGRAAKVAPSRLEAVEVDEVAGRVAREGPAAVRRRAGRCRGRRSPRRPR